jgi:hypothetical protein
MKLKSSQRPRLSDRHYGTIHTLRLWIQYVGKNPTGANALD